MQWNNHSQFEGMHAFLGASNYHWINWNTDVLHQRYYSQYATEIGTTIHELARDCIRSRMKLTKHDKHLVEMSLYHAGIPKEAYDSEMILTNLIPFVNDAIGYHMSSEVILFYSIECFGTTDAIVFNEKDKILRIHDLKTGQVPAHIEQLFIYAALFCLEYHKDPRTFKTELRFYQNLEVLIHNPEAEEIIKYMDLIKSRVQILQSYNERNIKR